MMIVVVVVNMGAVNVIHGIVGVHELV